MVLQDKKQVPPLADYCVVYYKPEGLFDKNWIIKYKWKVEAKANSVLNSSCFEIQNTKRTPLLKNRILLNMK